ncbi:MAG: hypothetical protein HY340_01455 [Candidatus Kerfeldbacteria bacterium]|nr:hypothetical protein [Candidatus Kerfeldbacteria bacterium]
MTRLNNIFRAGIIGAAIIAAILWQSYLADVPPPNLSAPSLNLNANSDKNRRTDQTPAALPDPAYLTDINGTTVTVPDETAPLVNEAPSPVTETPSENAVPTPPKPKEDSVPKGVYKNVMTTWFWVGEAASDDNGNISNAQSAWDDFWQDHFGGVDDPDDRCDFRPCSFMPKENPFYFALPYNDLDENDERKESAKQVPWYDSAKKRISILKNQWIEVRYKGKSCYAQWQDVGPYHEDDFDYVFGTQKPQNRYDVAAGLDVSPAVHDCLGMTTNVVTSWRFLTAGEVPAGPWKEIVTKSDVNH